MKRLAALYIVFCLLLISCGGAYTMKPSGWNEYIVSNPEKVVFYKEASYKSESFKIEKIQKLRIDKLECADKMNYFSCLWRGFKSPAVIFYKVVLESGKVGYVNEVDFTDVFVNTGSAKYLDNFSFQTDYNRVWNAALDTLDDLGFVIAQMDKSDGYITTDRKESTRLRQKVSVRLKREGGGVKVKVSYYYEYLDTNVRSDGTSYDYWVEGHRSSGQTEKGIMDGIAERLERRR